MPERLRALTDHPFIIPTALAVLVVVLLLNMFRSSDALPEAETAVDESEIYTSVDRMPELISDLEEVVEAPLDEQVFVVVEQMPQLIGGLSAMQERVVYPELAKKAGIEGRVVIQFIVDQTGHVRQPRLLRGIGGGCDEAALAALRQMRFTPGLQRGKPVNVKMSIPVTFTLRD